MSALKVSSPAEQFEGLAPGTVAGGSDDVKVRGVLGEGDARRGRCQKNNVRGVCVAQWLAAALMSGCVATTNNHVGQQLR
jgi:hypothetical protein